jgi:hypothetical protein
MKLKEKLAEDYAEKRFHGPGSFTDQDEAFIAGFEKAREMAAAFIESLACDSRVSFLMRQIGEKEEE